MDDLVGKTCLVGLVILVFTIFWVCLPSTALTQQRLMMKTNPNNSLVL